MFEVGGVVGGIEPVDLAAGNDSVVGFDHAIGAVGSHEVVRTATATVAVTPGSS